MNLLGFDFFYWQHCILIALQRKYVFLLGDVNVCFFGIIVGNIVYSSDVLRFLFVFVWQHFLLE